MLELEATIERAVLVDPAGRRAEQVIEHRRDPLTGTVASLNGALGEKARAFLGAADVDLLRELEQKTRPGCPFCDAAAKGTRFPPDLVADGQLRVGKALAIPNLFAKAALDAVVIVDPASHVLFPSRIAAGALADAFRAARELVRLARARDASHVHHIAGMNFLPPSGSSMPHPHLQVHARGVPYSGLARAAALAAAWRERTGASFFAELLETERGGPRHVGRTGDVEWVAAFAPARQKEIWGVLPGVASLAELDDAGAASFAAGVSRIVSAYEAWGTHPFTFAFHASPEPGAAASWALHLKICARPAFRAQYVNFDTWFAPLFVGDDVHTETPEAYAARLRAAW